MSIQRSRSGSQALPPVQLTAVKMAEFKETKDSAEHFGGHTSVHPLFEFIISQCKKLLAQCNCLETQCSQGCPIAPAVTLATSVTTCHSLPQFTVNMMKQRCKYATKYLVPDLPPESVNYHHI